MRIDSEKLLQNTDIVQTISRYVPLKKQGSELVGTCPFHDDTTASLQVNSKKQIFKCFACGVGGDSIEFLTRMGRTFHEAVEELNGGIMPEGVSPEQRTVPKANPNSWRHVSPAPVNVGTINHYKHGAPSKEWAYRNENGAVIGYVVRFDTPNGKEVLPYIYATDGKRSEWRWMGFEKPRPLYNLNLINDSPGASIIVVEGEKTADAVQAGFDPARTVVTTWIGGANGIDNANFLPLVGRRVVLWPDNDAPGRKAMHLIHEKIGRSCPVVRWVNVPEELPEKWDGADKEWQRGELKSFVLENVSDVPTYVPEVAPIKVVVNDEVPSDGLFEAGEPVKPKNPKLEGPKNPPPPPLPEVEDTEIERLDNPHYRMLGYDKDENSRLAYYFFSFDAKAVIKLSPTSMNKANLMMLAPLNYWEGAFPGGGKSKFDVDGATQFLMGNSHKVGTFKDKFIRGRGAWVDEGRFIIHTGDKLIVDGEMRLLKEFRSRYVYEVGERLGFGTSQPLKSFEAMKLIQQAKWLMWDREINAYLLIGWCVLTPFCGILPWRPHIWVTGPAGSGKSWVMENIVKKLLGDTAVVVQGKTTEAGVRGLLQNDARPVLFDESDVDNHNDKERVQNVLALARSSSYSDGGTVGKGTQSGGSRTYTMRSAFAFSSIGVQLNQQSDRSRFTTLGLMSFEGKRTKEDFIEFERLWRETVTEQFVKDLQSRTMGMLAIILKNARTFADAVTHVIGQRRIGDQVGGMLAGAYALSTRNEISYEDAVEWVKNKDWSEEKGLELTKDEYQLFGKLIGHITRVETEFKTIERTIGELILIACNLRTEIGCSPAAASNRLRRLGFMIKDNMLLISNTADGIMSIIRDTSWSSNYNKILERLPGAVKVEPRTYFPGLKSRGVGLPLTMVIEGSGEIPYENYGAPVYEDAPF